MMHNELNGDFHDVRRSVVMESSSCMANGSGLEYTV